MDTLPPYFGVVIPGRPLITEFQQIDSTKAVTFIPNPATVPDLSFFLFPGAPISPGYGAILYYSTPPFQNWEIIGCVLPEKPSGFFRTNWTTNEEIARCDVVQLGVSFETLETIQNLNITNSGVEDRFAFAHKIALDLFQFMGSFSQVNHGSMVVPTNVFDRWMEKFERKYRIDPNFMMKQSI